MKKLLFNLKRGLFIAHCVFFTQLAFGQVPYLIKDIDQRAYDNSSRPYNFINVSGNVFFVGEYPDNKLSLWKTNPATGTQLVKKFDNFSIDNLTGYNSDLYFTHNDNISGYEVWKSDGTTAGTKMVKDINTSGSSSPTALISANGSLFFAANDGIHGFELWKINGKDAQPERITDINAGDGYEIYDLFVVGNTIFFKIWDEENGEQLWKSDNTETIKLMDFTSNGFGSGGFATINNLLFFVGSDDDTGRELWQSDGTILGTKRVIDIYEGEDDSDIDNLT